MTGGGIYPAIAVLQALENKNNHILWVGSENGMEEKLLRNQNLTFRAIPAAGLHGVSLIKTPGNLIKLYKGYQSARKLLDEFQPDVIFYTGGYVGVPLAFANTRKIPSVVFIPDIEPGSALRQILPKATIIAVSNQESKNFVRYKEKTRISGYPVRKDLLKWNRASGRKIFRIPNHAQVIFVFGGSKGSRSINQALMQNLKSLTQNYHIIHVSGEENWQTVKTNFDHLEQEVKDHYMIFPFLHDEMGAALAAADLVVCRAGASTLGELPAFGLPAILVPYPYAWRYQIQNAQFLENNKGAVVVADNLLGSLLEEIIKEIFNQPDRLKTLKENMKRLHQPQAAQRIAQYLVEASRTECKEAR